MYEAVECIPFTNCMCMLYELCQAYFKTQFADFLKPWTGEADDTTLTA